MLAVLANVTNAPASAGTTKEPKVYRGRTRAPWYNKSLTKEMYFRLQAIDDMERQLQEQAQEMHTLRQQLTSAAMELQRVSVDWDHTRVDLERVRTNNAKLEAEARESAADLQRGRAAVEEEARRRHAEQEAAARLRTELEKALDAFQAAERERTHWKSTAPHHPSEFSRPSAAAVPRGSGSRFWRAFAGSVAHATKRRSSAFSTVCSSACLELPLAGAAA